MAKITKTEAKYAISTSSPAKSEIRRIIDKIEDEDEYVAGEKIKKMNPYDFWTFVKNRKILKDNNTSTYVQDLCYTDRVNSKLGSLVEETKQKNR